MLLKRLSTTSMHPRDVYAKKSLDPEQRKINSMMLLLVEYLETNVIAPAHWAYAQADDLVIKNIDSPLGGRRVYVSVKQDTSSSGMDEYEITYFVPSPWWSVTGYTHDIVIAGQMISEALERTVERLD